MSCDTDWGDSELSINLSYSDINLSQLDKSLGWVFTLVISFVNGSDGEVEEPSADDGGEVVVSLSTSASCGR